MPENDDIPQPDPQGATGSPPPDPEVPRRLLDELVAYVRRHQRTSGEPIDDEKLIGMIIHHLRRNPIPTALLGFSLSWLLLAGGKEDEEEEAPDLGFQVEEEIREQLTGGLNYTNARLREVVDRYPWAAAAGMVGGGLLAAFFLPERRRRAQAAFVEEVIAEEQVEGEGFDFEGPEEGDEEIPR